jgi:hypothetical protein
LIQIQRNWRIRIDSKLDNNVRVQMKGLIFGDGYLIEKRKTKIAGTNESLGPQVAYPSVDKPQTYT